MEQLYCTVSHVIKVGHNTYSSSATATSIHTCSIISYIQSFLDLDHKHHVQYMKKRFYNRTVLSVFVRCLYRAENSEDDHVVYTES